MVEKLLTAADVAEILGVNTQRVHVWRQLYDWPHVKISGTYRFTSSQVEQIIEAHSVGRFSRNVALIPGQLSGQTRLSAVRQDSIRRRRRRASG